jgi:hypothetical protein
MLLARKLSLTLINTTSSRATDPAERQLITDRVARLKKVRMRPKKSSNSSSPSIILKLTTSMLSSRSIRQ